jgi:hypothetical protein
MTPGVTRHRKRTQLLSARCAALCLIVGGLLTNTAAAQPRPGIVRAPNAPVVDDSSAELAVLEFDQAALSEVGPNATLNVQNRFEWLLDKRIASLDRRYSLSPSQKQRLRLAARGDMQRFFERVDVARQKYIADRRRNAVDAVRAVDAQSVPFHDDLKVGPFMDGSLFSKALATVLSPEQLEKSEQRRARAAGSPLKITLENGRRLETAARFQKDVRQLGWTGRENEIALLADGGPVEICSRDTFQLLRTIGKGQKLAAFDIRGDWCVAAEAGHSTKAFLINLSSGREIELQADLREPIPVLSRDGKLLATGGNGLRALVWFAETGTRRAELLMGEIDGILIPAFSPDGTIVAISNSSARTCLFDAATGQLLRRLPWEKSHELKVDPSGKRLAVAYADGNLAIWDVATGELWTRVLSRTEEAKTLDWSPDGKLLASGGRIGSVTVWKAAGLTTLIDLDAPDSVDCVRFNPEGTRLYVAGGSLKAGRGRSVEVFAVSPE